jgi:hypothetical protein
MFLGKLDIHLQKTEIRSMFVTLYRYQHKWIKNINIRPETLKLVQERAENTLVAIGIGNGFLSRTQVAQQLRERFSKQDYMRLKSVYRTKEMVTKLKRPSKEWEKIFASYMSI